MSEESIKGIFKKHRKSKREGEGLKVKKGRKSGPGTAENGCDVCEGRHRLDPSIAKLELMKDSMSPRRAEDQLSRTLDMPPDTLSKVRASGKRKRTDHDAVFDESINSKTDDTEVEPQRNKKCDEYRTHCLPYPDPAIDTSLSEQSRRALSYAYERCRANEVWKFNKARQNWLLRNVWSEQAVPENYVPLVMKYLVDIRGGAREKLIGECISKMSTDEMALMQAAQPFGDIAKAGSAINQQPNTSRALFILHALNKTS